MRLSSGWTPERLPTFDLFMVHPGYRKRIIILLIGLLLVRFWFAQTFELSGPEAYLWQMGENLSPAYWGHGPFVPWLIRLGTIFYGNTELGVRGPAAVIACLSGFALFFQARHWFTARAGFWTVVLFTIVPMFAWKLSFMTEATASIGLMAVAMVGFCRAVEEDKFGWWLLGGIACGFALLVAIANAWWLVGLILYFVVNPERRVHLREPLLWSALIISVLFLLPVIWWWHGAQVADIRHTHILNAWPLSHRLSLNDGFHFVWLEIWYLCPFFFALLVYIVWRLRGHLWSDARYGMLISLAVPGLIWQNFSAFFQEGNFEMVPALMLPLVLLVGCSVARLTHADKTGRWVYAVVFAFAALQSLAGLNPFYLFAKSDGQGYQFRRMVSGDNVTGFEESKRELSWRNFADEIQRMQADQGATLLITDNPNTAAALSFYLPHNPFVYVESRSDLITHFDFWTQYDESASPNDSALFITRTNEPPPPDLFRDFTTVTEIDDPPLPEFDRTWNIWSCKNFRGTGQPTTGRSAPLPESDALPK